MNSAHTMTETPRGLADPPRSDGQQAPLRLLNDVLGMVRLAGALFLRAEYTAPWALESPPSQDLVQMLQPRARRLILFHIVADGHVAIRVTGGPALEADAGEVIVLPYGDHHVMGSDHHVPPVP